MSVFRTSLEVPGSGTVSHAAVMAAGQSEAAPVPAVREYPGKRVLDFALATVALLVSAPLWLVIAAAIWLEDGRPVFYRQRRWGRWKTAFRVYKFRTMVADADRRFGAVQAGQHDPRVTRVGRALRATSLDELPQLLNIWRGDMSWVGPRALPINEKQINETADRPDHTIDGFDLRCTVRPGLTGVAQIFAPRDVPRRRKFRYDSFYIRRQTFALDLRLIAISLWISVRLRWEDRRDKVGWRAHGRHGGRRGDV